MGLKVIVPNGRTEITVNGLHQWDYGRAIEIHAEGLPAIVEVHFACSGMETAIVRSCGTVDGKITAAIPDRCLEQTTPVTAWVYAIGETSGETILTVKMPIIARAQPQLAPTVPEDVSNKYTEAVAAMDALVKQSEKMIGDVANEVEDRIAGNLYNEGWKARFAGRADTAIQAEKDAEGVALRNLLRSPEDGYTQYEIGGDVAESSFPGGILAFKIVREDANSDIRLITEVGGEKRGTNYSAVFYDEVTGGKEVGIFPMRLVFTHKSQGEYNVKVQFFPNDAWADLYYGTYPAVIYYKHLRQYSVG